jgi:hypothetical protein
MDNIEESIKEIAKYVKSEVKRLESQDIPEHDRDYLERIEKAKEEIDSNLRILQLLKQDIEAMKSETGAIETKIRKIEEKLPAIKTDNAETIEDRLEFLEKEVKESLPTKNMIEEESILRMGIEKRLKDLEKSKPAMPVSVDLDKRMDELERRLASVETYKAEKTVKSKIANVPVSDGRIASLERRINMLEKSRQPSYKAEPVYSFDKNVELKMSSYMSEQLQNFAKALDKRLPNTALIEDYNRKLAELEKKINSIGSGGGTKIERVKSPDLAKLTDRVAILEKRMTELIALIKGFSSRMPVVVE